MATVGSKSFSQEDSLEPVGKVHIGIVVTLFRPNLGMQVVYGNEINYRLPTGMSGPHGDLDLFVTEMNEEDLISKRRCILVNTLRSDSKPLSANQPAYGEAKNPSCTSFV